jgi:ABC-type antimicrobial peptide transport system permease subunit
MVDQFPLSGNFGSRDVYRDQTTEFTPANVVADVMTFRISPGYFRAAQTTMLMGRPFSWHDDRDAPRVAVVNRQFAKSIFGSLTNALGNHFKLANGTRVEVVGITEDGKYYQLTEDLRPALFLSMAQWPSSATNLIVRSERKPEPLAAALRLKLKTLDAGLPFEIRSWNDELSISLFVPRVASISLGLLGGMGGVLAITGIFGMAAYSVSKRLRELGIRMALGAQRKEVLRTALGRPLKLLVLGSAAGLGLGMLASRVLAYIVFQANPRDPLVLMGVVITMLLMGLFATWIPAQRALSVDPLILLRED